MTIAFNDSTQSQSSTKSRILIVGATGGLGRYVAEASVQQGYETFVLAQPSSLANPVKAATLTAFQETGIHLLHADWRDHASLVAALQNVDVVISTVAGMQEELQMKLIEAIKEAGHIKRFYPSEFGPDVDTTRSSGPFQRLFEMKARVRRAIEAAGIPHTYVIAGCFFGWFVDTLCQVAYDNLAPPRNKVIIYGSGDVQVAFQSEWDVATYLIKSVDDPRVENKMLYLLPEDNILTQNQMTLLWEKKIGKTLEKEVISEEEFLKGIDEAGHPLNFFMGPTWTAFFKGFTYVDSGKLSPDALEASKLYPEVQYSRVTDYLNKFL